MMNKPDILEVLEIMRMKEEAATLYERVDAMVSNIMSEFGPGRFDYDLEVFFDEWNPDNGYPYDQVIMKDGRYLKFELTDNIKKLAEGGDVWKSVGFKPVSFELRNLKRCPDSLK